MAGERSHGKARPRLPRASDLHEKSLDHAAIAATDADRRRQRDAHGRFAPGNALAIGRGNKAFIRRGMGAAKTVTDPEALQVARDANRLFNEVLRTLPDDSAMTRQLLALYARETALCAFWSARASVVGLGSDDGIKAQDRAQKHGQRAERLSVSLLDVAKDLAAMRPKPDPLAALRATWERPTEPKDGKDA